MIEFISLLIGYVLMGFAESIDNAFATHIDLDTIVVLGCLASIQQVCKAISRIGSYYYRISREKESQAIQLNLICGLFIGVLIFIIRDGIVGLFSITTNQSIMLKNVLGIWSIYIPIQGVCDACFEITRLKGKIKMYNIGLFLYYFMIIGLDVIIFITKRTLSLLLCGTIVSLIFTIIFFCKMLHLKYEIIDKKLLREAFKFGIPIALERLINGICLMIYGIFASTLDTMSYAIHSVCLGVITTAEQVTNSYNAALMIKVPLNQTFNEVRKNIINYAKKMFLILFIIYNIYIYISLFVYSGEVGIEACFPWFLTYTLSFFGLFIYENTKCMCALLRNLSAYPLGVIVGFVLRLLISIIGLHTNTPLIWFGIAASIDWGARGLVYYTSCVWKNKKLFPED